MYSSPEGHVKLVDFGCCTRKLRAYTLVGTPDYLAPEVILGKGYTCAVDWWAVGVMMYEFLCGPLPFGQNCTDRLGVFREILEEPLKFPTYVQSKRISCDILSSLLERSPEQRLGSSSQEACEVRAHGFFEGFDWDALLERTMAPPWHPKVGGVVTDGDIGIVNTGPCEPQSPGTDLSWAEGF